MPDAPSPSSQGLPSGRRMIWISSGSISHCSLLRSPSDPEPLMNPLPSRPLPIVAAPACTLTVNHHAALRSRQERSTLCNEGFPCVLAQPAAHQYVRCPSISELLKHISTPCCWGSTLSVRPPTEAVSERIDDLNTKRTIHTLKWTLTSEPFYHLICLTLRVVLCGHIINRRSLWL